MKIARCATTPTATTNQYDADISEEDENGYEEQGHEAEVEHVGVAKQQVAVEANKLFSKEENEYLELQKEKDSLLEKATKRTSEENTLLKKINNRMSKLSKRQNVLHLLKPKTVAKTHAELKRMSRANLSLEEKEEERKKAKLRMRTKRK